ncbi:uncharacterized protein LOC129564966 [Sitodiplosis mosellana]|uniref:uncharacterized protein LOC129564966 n=1 Tax=Sitodiplosis mosellana TaxID=263140 RepID=UPI002443CA9E|nr:uncharacterized protein LOC129564966 [Sitodiplosis mosellana]
MNCEHNSDFLSTIEEKYFAHPYHWIIIDTTNDSIQNLTFLPDSNIILANKDRNSDRYTLKQVYKIAKETPLLYEDFGIWNQKEGLIDLRTTRILSRRRRNLQGHQFKASAALPTEGSEIHTDLDDYQYKDPKTGEITGMCGRLQRKEVDIGASVVLMTIERVEYLDYLSMEVPTEFAFMLRPPPISYVSNIYYLPFTGLVWICSILLVILCTFIVTLTLKFRLMPDEGTDHMTTSDYVIFATASTCQMGSEYLTKFVFFTAMLFLYTSFTANIVALLQSTTKSFRTISHLQNPAIEVGVHDTPYNRHFFKMENEATRKLLYDTKIAPPGKPDAFMNISYGVSRMREGMFAFHSEISPSYTEVERTFFENEKCGIVEIDFYGMADTWCVIQKRSPYKEILKAREIPQIEIQQYLHIKVGNVQRTIDIP